MPGVMSRMGKVTAALLTIIVVAIALIATITLYECSVHKSVTRVASYVYYSSPNFEIVGYNGTSITVENYGSNVTMEIPVERIVADNTVAMQILIDIGGAENTIVGIEGYAAELPWLFGNLTALPAVSQGMWSWNYEEMVNLKPDLVIEWSYGVQTVRSKLNPFGIPVIGYGPQDNLSSFIYLLGLITNHTDNAVNLIDFINNVHQVLRKGLSKVLSRYKAYVIFDYEYSPWFTSGPTGDPYWAAVNAGLQPCFNKSMQVEPSAVLQCNPDVIIAVTWSLNPHSPNATAYCESIINSIRSNPILNATNAVRYGRVIVIPGYLTEGGPPQLIVSLYIASQVYPSAFAGVNATQYLNQYFEEFLRTAEPGGVWWCSG